MMRKFKDKKKVKREKKQFSINERKRTEILQKQNMYNGIEETVHRIPAIHWETRY